MPSRTLGLIEVNLRRSQMISSTSGPQSDSDVARLCGPRVGSAARSMYVVSGNRCCPNG